LHVTCRLSDDIPFRDAAGHRPLGGVCVSTAVCMCAAGDMTTVPGRSASVSYPFECSCIPGLRLILECVGMTCWLHGGSSAACMRAAGAARLAVHQHLERAPGAAPGSKGATLQVHGPRNGQHQFLLHLCRWALHGACHMIDASRCINLHNCACLESRMPLFRAFRA
jgi:hypothetical protein